MLLVEVIGNLKCIMQRNCTNCIFIIVNLYNSCYYKFSIIFFYFYHCLTEMLTIGNLIWSEMLLKNIDLKFFSSMCLLFCGILFIYKEKLHTCLLSLYTWLCTFKMMVSHLLSPKQSLCSTRSSKIGVLSWSTKDKCYCRSSLLCSFPESAFCWWIR